MSLKRLLLAGFMVLVVSAGRAQAAPILGAQLFYTGGAVTVESLPVTSGYVSELGLYDSTFTRLLYLMNDEPVGVTNTFTPSDYGIAVGAELIFGIRVISDGNREYFMGPGLRNPDGIIHAAVDNLGGGVLVVGFEDLFGGGDLDYDDNKFRFTGAVVAPATVPEPASMLLLGSGLAGVAARGRRRRKQ
jgi:hypothetical protein